MLRTHTCGELNEKHIGQTVTLYGWVDTMRDHGGVFFIDLRDRYGKTQLVAGGKGRTFDNSFKSEDCIRVEGKVQKRPAGTENPKLPTGQVEVIVENVLEHNASEPLPFEVTKSHETNEELRLKHRYLDLRNPEVQKGLFARHRVYQIIRTTLDRHGFIEVETPILTKSTPEGARDYLVPSRVNQGEFYALPQSPQLFKQILMVSGFDRYFQIAKCFRDEDLRADRQPEFTQLDMEMSFLDEDTLFGIIEEVMKAIFKEVPGIDLKTPFPRLTYQEATAKYGSDKPDLRFGMPIEDVSELVRGCEFKVFGDDLASPDGAILALCIPAGSPSRKDIDTLTEFAKAEGAGGLAYFKAEGGRLEAPIAKFFKPEHLAALRDRMKPNDGDLIVFAADSRKKGQKILGAVRVYAAKWIGVAASHPFHFSWITDFPLFQYDEEEKRWASEHHPFTSPHPEDWAKYKKAGELGKIRSRAYDLVLNGNEIASGSVRIHNRNLQNEIFETIGLSKEEIQNRFGFLLGAFQYGTPPHGGLAFGVDRLVAIALGLESIREVIAFPKNQKAVDPMTDAPSPVAEKQLKELGHQDPVSRVEARLAEGVRGLTPAWVHRVVAFTLKKERKADASASVYVTGDREIRRLNREHLKHDYATDVISFWIDASTLTGREGKALGDVVASADTARRVARELGIPFREEMARYLVHGTLHLLGYRDEKKKDKMKMHRRQERILRDFFAGRR